MAMDRPTVSLDRIPGPDNIYVGGIFTLRRTDALRASGVTHILSVIDYSLDKWEDLRAGRCAHLSIDIDDVEDADLLVELPRCVRFIESGLYPTGRGSSSKGEEGKGGPPAVFVHCAMGKSRSVTAAIAYLLWKRPEKFGGAGREGRDDDDDKRKGRTPEGAKAAVQQALDLVRQARELAEPNDGFMRQLELWWLMGCPASSDDAVEKHAVYRKWAYQREVEESARIGRAPEYLRFEDEEESNGNAGAGDSGKELRCKKCRRVLATQQFFLPHRAAAGAGAGDCQHVFIEPLSWMRGTLERGELEGRLACPNERCGASVGRYSWQGFKCSCREWVCPAFSLQRSKVDEAAVPPGGGGRGGGGTTAAAQEGMGIRLPPGLRKENL